MAPELNHPEKVESVHYTSVEQSYFDKRGLRKYARALHLWAIGVGAVISGDFSVWNLGLAADGFGALLIATTLITVMCFGLCFSIAEMSPALPHTGGAYSFARASMGPWGGYITGLAENIEYVITAAVISYILQMLAFIILRVRLPKIERPYRSPLGVPGAALALMISAVTLVTLFYSDPVYKMAVIGAAIWYALGLLYFVCYARRRLVRSPEEEFALTQRS